VCGGGGTRGSGGEGLTVPFLGGDRVQYLVMAAVWCDAGSCHQAVCEGQCGPWCSCVYIRLQLFGYQCACPGGCLVGGWEGDGCGSPLLVPVRLSVGVGRLPWISLFCFNWSSSLQRGPWWWCLVGKVGCAFVCVCEFVRVGG